MSTAENPLKRKNEDVKDEGVKKRDIELTEFTKYARLADKSRHHILSYCNISTLLNYSQCSKFCNFETQKFNIVAPRRLTMKEESDGIVVELHYAKNRVENFFLEHYNGVQKKFIFSEATNVMEEIQKYLVERYKHVKQGNTVAIEVDVRKWPIKLMEWKKITHVEFCTVVMYKSMLNDFMDHFENQNIKVLTLSECAEISDPVTIPPQFFKAEAFQKLRAFYGEVECEIDSEDFMNLSKEPACLKSSISFHDIRAIVRKWNSESSTKNRFIDIELPEDDDRVFDLFDIFPSDQFDVVSMGLGMFQIGNVYVDIEVDEKSIKLSNCSN